MKNLRFEIEIANVGSWHKIQICQVYKGQSSILKNGQWDAQPEETFRDVVLTLDKCFDGYLAAERYAATNKSLKAILKIVSKNQL